MPDVEIYVPDIPEFEPLLEAGRKAQGCTVRAPVAGYWTIAGEREILFHRKELGLGPALWNSALTGGFRGRIEEYGRDVMRIVAEDEGGAE